MTSGSDSAPSKGERTRQALLTAAVARFGRDGFRSTSVATIARDAHLSSTAAYPYFASKEALFIAAVNADAAAVISEGLLGFLDFHGLEWLPKLLPNLLAALDRHPLAKRVLAGLEPDFTIRLLRVDALVTLRQILAERLRSSQQAGQVRADIDTSEIADGLMLITLSLLMAMVQTHSGPDVLTAGAIAVFEAALLPALTPSGIAATALAAGE